VKIMEQLSLIIISTLTLSAALFLLLRWLYVRSMRIRNRLQMEYIFTNITHDMLTPLTILSASIDQLRTKLPEGKWHYDLMELNIQRSVHLLQQILETSKAQSGNLKLLVSQGDMMHYITETARSIEPLMASKNLTFTIQCKPESMMGWIDTDKLDKIIFNLLSNAVKYTPENGSVSLDVATNRNYDHLIIRISDNGCGIPKEKMKHLFSRFYDGDYRRNQTTGTGLGLSLTRDLVYLHGGTIHCDSTEGKGSTFTVELPINKEAFAPSQIDEKNKVQPRSNIIDLPRPITITAATDIVPTAGEDAHRILVVDDQEDLLELMKQLLSQHYRVMTARNGQEALNIIENNTLDLIVSDVMMPDMDGYELTTAIKQNEQLSHLPIILLTAKTQEEDKQKALTTGADDYITKPFKIADLELRIDNIIANRLRIRPEAFEEEEAEGQSAPLTPEQEFLQRATNCVLKHIDDSDYDREEFAADMGASASTLYNKLRSLTGMNVTTFIRSIRIKRACQLAIEFPDLRVSDIAYRVGFKDPKYFATTFKKELGVQPKEYFDQLRSQEDLSPTDL